MSKQDPLDYKGLPEAVSAETLVLGGILNQSLDFYTCRSTLSSADFVLEAHRKIYSTIERMSNAGIAIDHATVAQEMTTHGELESVGGLTYLVQLDSDAPRLPHFDRYIRTIKDKAILRKTVQISDSIRNKAILGEGNPQELLSHAEQMLVQLGLEASSSDEFRTPEQVIMAAGNLQNYLHRGKQLGVPTGFDSLDRMTCGMRPGQLWILASFTSGGKSTFSRNIALNAARRGCPGAIITLEMSEDEVTDGLICAAGGIDSQIIRRGLGIESAKVRAAALEVSNLPIFIRDRAGTTIPQIHGALRKLKAERNITYAIVDYLQLLTPVGRFDNRTNEVSHLSRGLKGIAVDLKIPILALSQFRRVGEIARRPQLSDLRESGSIEQDANVVILLHSERIETPMESYPTEVIVAKQRNGPLGTLAFQFHKANGVFFEATDPLQRSAA